MCLFRLPHFLPSHENQGCCGEGNSQNVAAQGEICTADNTSDRSFYFYFCFL